MKVIIAGTRTITDYAVLLRTVSNCKFSDRISEVIVGCDEEDFNKGKLNFDILGYVWGRLNRKKVHCRPVTPQEWNRYGKPAGPMRNEKMAAEGEGLMACWDGLSRGTRDMIMAAQARGLPVFVEPLYPLSDEESELWWEALLSR